MATSRPVKPGKSSRLASFTAGKATNAAFSSRKNKGGSQHVKPPSGVKEKQRRPRKRAF